jgi:hypothetical protein
VTEPAEVRQLPTARVAAQIVRTAMPLYVNTLIASVGARTDFGRHLPLRGGVPGQRAEPLVLTPPDP